MSRSESSRGGFVGLASRIERLGLGVCDAAEGLLAQVIAADEHVAIEGERVLAGTFGNRGQ
jgi:hypothetical protein